MSFFQKHIAVNRAIASLLILVCFVFPSTSFAWGYGPGTAPQPKILYLDDEKKFLDEFHAKKKDILFNDNLKWRETSEGSYVLDLPDTTNPMGEKIPVRFVMVPQKKETRFWNLYAQEKKNNQWEYKYKGSPLGYLENFESREPTFVSYLTSSNIQSALDKLKITYQENRSVEVAMTSEMIIENFPSAAAGVACEDLIAQQFDKDKYGMVATVYDALPKEMATKVREYKNYEGFKRGVAGTPNVNPNGSVLGPKKHTPFDDAKVELARIARDEAFKTSLAGTIAFQHRFYGKLDEQKWTNVLTNSTNVSEDTASNPKYQKLLQENLSKIIPLTQPTMTVDEKLKLIAEFNDLHKSINQSCQAAAVEYRKSEASTGTILHGEKPYTASDRQVMNFNQKNRDARAALEAKYKNQFTPQIKQLLATNQLGFLFGSEKFQERVGTFDAEDCFKSGNSGLKEGISLADVYVGQLESMKNNFAALDDRMEEYQSDQYMDILQRYVASYPLLMKNINSRLTSSYKDTQMLRLSCMAVDGIYEDEKMERFIDYGFMGVALIAGALTVGTGAAVVLSVMGGVTAVEATEAGLDWYGGYQLQMHGRKGLLSGNNTVNGALSVVDRGKALVTQAKWDFALTIVSYGVGDVLAEGYKASKASKALSPSKATTTEVVEQTATVEAKTVTKPETKVIQLNQNVDEAVDLRRVAASTNSDGMRAFVDPELNDVVTDVRRMHQKMLLSEGELTDELILENRNALQKLKEKLQKHGYESSIQSKPALTIMEMHEVLVIKPSDVGGYYQKVAQKMKISEIRIDLVEWSRNPGFGGTMRPGSAYQYFQAKEVSAIINGKVSVTKAHEDAHMMFQKMRSDGKDSVFHMTFSRGNNAAPLVPDGSYADFLMAEEVYNYSKDAHKLTLQYEQSIRDLKKIDVNDTPALNQFIEKENLVGMGGYETVDYSTIRSELASRYVDDLEQTVTDLNLFTTSFNQRFAEFTHADFPSSGLTMDIRSSGELTLKNPVTGNEVHIPLVTEEMKAKAAQYNPFFRTSNVDKLKIESDMYAYAVEKMKSLMGPNGVVKKQKIIQDQIQAVLKRIDDGERNQAILDELHKLTLELKRQVNEDYSGFGASSLLN